MSRFASFAAIATIALLAACGGKSSNNDSSTPGSEPLAPLEKQAPPADATPLAPCSGSNSSTTVGTQSIGSVSGPAVLATSPPNDGRLFVVEQSGRLRIFINETLVATPFLDITGTDLVTTNDEQGLLGLAFDPDYATNGFFYIDYTANAAQGSAQPFVDKVVRYKVSAGDPNVADPASATVLLAIPDPFVNHNGGMLEFGNDGFLYIATGDGGSGGDPERNGQNPHALLAKILRIDPDHPANGLPYGIPAGNPFANGTNGAPEVFIMGVRNPWRWSFDRMTGDMWIADVGQNITEEVDVLRPAQQAGANLGWSAFEANACCATQSDKCSQTGTQQACDMTGLFFPQVTHSHSPEGWLAIIGGQVYRGSCYAGLVGKYFYTDNQKAGMSQATFGSDDSVTSIDLPGTWPSSPSSIHADARGELYETTTSGEVFHIIATP